MDHRVQLPEVVRLLREAAHLIQVGQVADDAGGSPIEQIAERLQPLLGASVDDDIVPVVEQRPCGGQPETVRRAGDQDARHEVHEH